MGVVRELVRALIGEPVKLPAELAARWPELAGVRYRRGGLPPRIGGWCLGTTTVAAIALGRTVYLAPGEPCSAALLLHELRHVQQFQSTPAFPARYLWESLRRGYRANRFEVDAREYAARRLVDAPRRSPFSADV